MYNIYVYQPQIVINIFRGKGKKNKNSLNVFHSCSYERRFKHSSHLCSFQWFTPFGAAESALGMISGKWLGVWHLAVGAILQQHLAWECWTETGWWKAMEVVWIKTLIHMGCTETAKPTNSSLAHDPCHADEEHHTPNVQHAADLRRGRMAVRF